MTSRRPAIGAGPDVAADPGSFRDRDGRVVRAGGRILRGLTARALAAHERLEASPACQALMAQGDLVTTRRLPPAEAPDLGSDAAGRPWAAVLEHEAVPCVSYPYEWCPAMLADAGRLVLDVLAAVLSEDLVLKDGTPYNVQWRGVRPVFVDTPSLVPCPPGGAWPGFRQFCELCLYPLMLHAYRGVDARPWLRGRLSGITAGEARRLLRGRDLLRPGVLGHVHLPAWLAARAPDAAGGDARLDERRELAEAGFHRGLLERTVRRLRRLVDRVDRPLADSAWSGYADRRPYDDGSGGAKHEIVAQVVSARRRRSVWDLGCNDGTFSRLAATHADHVLALDADVAVVDRLFRALRDDGPGNVLPLAIDGADPSPGLGFRRAERTPLEARDRPDLVLVLALLHHLVVGAELPLPELIDALADLGGDLVVEFAGRDDPMVRRLLARRDEAFADYDERVLRAALGRRFRRVESVSLGGGPRTLFVAEGPLPAAGRSPC